MSTTKNPAVALDYSGGVAAKGSIFCIDFDMSSRGAAVQCLSQYPHEEVCRPQPAIVLRSRSASARSSSA